jgi:hypothetical protein
MVSCIFEIMHRLVLQRNIGQCSKMSHMVTLLVILHQTQGCSGIQNWFGQYAGQQKSDLVNL